MWAAQHNTSKCTVIFFPRGETCIQADYSITELLRVLVVKDLGMHLSHTLSPENHIDVVCSRASRLLGLLSRAARNGLSIYSLTTLYRSLLCPILEHASVTWRFFYFHNITRLERIQRKFIRLVGWRLGIPLLFLLMIWSNNSTFILWKSPVSLLTWLFSLNLSTEPLTVRTYWLRSTSGSSSIRSKELFDHKHYRINYLNMLKARLPRIGNSAPAEMDFFCESMRTLKRKWIPLS